MDLFRRHDKWFSFDYFEFLLNCVVERSSRRRSVRPWRPVGLQGIMLVWSTRKCWTGESFSSRSHQAPPTPKIVSLGPIFCQIHNSFIHMKQHVLLVFYSYLVLLPQAVAGLFTLSLISIGVMRLNGCSKLKPLLARGESPRASYSN